MEIKRYLFSLGLALLLLLLLPLSVRAADPPLPDTQELDNILVLHHLLETNDMLILWDQTYSYNVTPEYNIAQMFTFKLISSDNATEYGAVTIYPYNNDGWGQGNGSMYFSAADAPTWGISYYLRVDTNPSLFLSGYSKTYVLSPADYTSEGTTALNQAALYDSIISRAEALSLAWALALLDETDTGAILSSTGEAYYRNVIRGLQGMSPDLFFLEIVDPDVTTRTWDTTLVTTLRNRYSGTWVGTYMMGFGGLFNMDQQTGTAFVFLVVAIALLGLAHWKYKKTLPGFMLLVPLFAYAALDSWVSLTLWLLISWVCGMLFGFILFLQKA